MNRKVVVVVGMHRSGTSLLAHMLHLLGVELGDNLIPANSYNPEGYWECQQITQTQIQIYRELDRVWHRPVGCLPLPVAWWRQSEFRKYVEALREIVAESILPLPKLWGFKDPHTVRLLPMWKEIFHELEIEPIYIHAVRNPSAVIQSVHQRNKLEYSTAELAWLTHNIDAIRYTPQNSYIVHYENWFSQPVEQFYHLSDYLNLEWLGDQYDLENLVAKIIKPEFNHFSEKSVPISLEFTHQLYELLKTENSNQGRSDKIDQLIYHFLEYQKQLTPWMKELERLKNECDATLEKQAILLEEKKTELKTKQKALTTEQQQHQKATQQLQQLQTELQVSRKDIKIEQQQLKNKTQQLHKLQVQLEEQERQLLETQQKLTTEQQQKRELISQLSKAKEKLKSLNLRLVPSWEQIAENKYPSLADDLVAADCSEKRLKICIVSQDIFGPIRNGGIGTAYYHVANFLHSCGHNVTIFYSLGNHCETGTIEDWIEYYAERGITFVPAPWLDIPSAKGPLGQSMLIARKVYDYLKTQSFDIVHVSEWKGNGYYALLAKKLGLAFANTKFCVKTSSPTLWATMGNSALVNDPKDLLTSYIERKSVEWADIVISPSRHMLGWMERHGYELPKERCYVHPNIMPVSDRWNSSKGRKITYLKNVRELVFFGRLEPRKGIQVFCKALTRLEKEGGIGCKVVFLGKYNPVRFDAASYIQSQAENWSFEWELITDYNALQAMEYLKTNNRLAVVPSLLDNSPFTIYECLAERIPFICSDQGGTPELVYEEDRPEVVIPAHPTKLAKRLRQILTQGVKVARPAFDFRENLETWAKWHFAMAHNPNLRLECSGIKEKPLIAATPQEKPLVSICMAHFNRPKELSQALESIKNQTYNNYEVILVDDGSDKPEAIAYLDSLEQDFAARGWQIVRQENLYLGAVRNTGVRHAKGEYVLLMDDDNCAKPHEIETFVAAAQYSDADILTAFADTFEGEDAPPIADVKSRLTPVGDCLSYGLLGNCYGDSNSLIKRSFFEKLGGFTEDYGVGLDDQEFFSRAILNGGKLFVVPEALYWYRISQTRLRTLHFNLNAGTWRVFQPYLANGPWISHDLFRLAIGLFSSYNQTKGKVKNLKQLTEQFQKDFSRVKYFMENKKN